MSGETEKQVSGWTVDTLKEHLEALVTTNDQRYEQRFTAQEKAIAVAEANAEKWRLAANEWRGAMNDRERNLSSRAETEAVDSKVDALAKRIDRSEGRAGGLHSGWGYLIGAIGLVAGLVAIFFALAR